MAEDDDLLQGVGGGHPHLVLFPQLVGDLLDILIRCLSLLGVDHREAAVVLH